MSQFSIRKPEPASPIRPQADIVFCIDVTESMKPCLEGLKGAVDTFVQGLQSKGNVDFRLRLIAYRDLHDPNAKNDPPWTTTPFTRSVDEFRRALGGLEAVGGADLPESTLDALYLALHSDWRPNQTHKTVILLTDDDTHPTLHRSTYQHPDNDVSRVIQDFQTLRHIMLFIVAPRYPIYERIQKSMLDAERKIVAQFFPPDDNRYEGLAAIPWPSLMNMIGATVSATSVAIAKSAGS